MKKKILLRFGMVCALTVSSLVLFQDSVSEQYADNQQFDEEVIPARPSKPSGDFLIWESISRYIMATWH